MAERAPQYCVLPFTADTGLNTDTLYTGHVGITRYNTKHQQMPHETLQLVSKQLNIITVALYCTHSLLLL